MGRNFSIASNNIYLDGRIYNKGRDIMEIWEQYSKEIIENFAINVVAKSFNKKYSTYFSPENSDNFDFISPDETEALEVTLVIPENERREYIYEREKHKGKKDLKKITLKMQTLTLKAILYLIMEVQCLK